MRLRNTASVTAILVFFGLILPAHAAPVGPSAKAAAGLKKNPRTQWLAHYLPDDRYKIAGGVWKYVTTNLDTYYHLPSSSNMMRQPNAGVIGFASAREAEEAGYKADPRDGTLQQVRNTVEQKQLAMEKEAATAARNGGKRTYIRPSGKVILGDGRSTLVVPADWQRLISTTERDADGLTSFDVMIHPRSKKTAVLLTMIFRNINVERELQADNMRASINRFSAAVNSSGQISNTPTAKTGDWLIRARVRRTRWGGLNGVAMSPPPGVGAGAGNMLMVGRGNKAYIFIIAGEGKAPASTSNMIKSFRAR